MGEKEGPRLKEYFKDFVNQMTVTFLHKQVDNLTSDIHHRTLLGVDEDSKCLGVHFDISQDLAHAQAVQSMCDDLFVHFNFTPLLWVHARK